MDEPAENLWSHGQHPFDRYVPIETGEFYGTSMVEMMSPMQESINGLLRSMEHNIWLLGNPPFIEDVRAGISRTVMTNKPGQRITKNSGGDAGWLSPPSIAPGVVSELIRFYIDEMERVSGLSAVVRGATPTGRNAQGVIDSVQEAAFVRIRKTRRNLSMTIGSAGEKAAALIVEFYDKPRIVTLLGSCVSITVWSPRLLVGGMCHFMLPSRGVIPEGATYAGRYGDEAMMQVINIAHDEGVAVARGR
jgi:hypothetical protein